MKVPGALEALSLSDKDAEALVEHLEDFDLDEIMGDYDPPIQILAYMGIHMMDMLSKFPDCPLSKINWRTFVEKEES